jgi:hypothetical protein
MPHNLFSGKRDHKLGIAGAPCIALTIPADLLTCSGDGEMNLDALARTPVGTAYRVLLEAFVEAVRYAFHETGSNAKAKNKKDGAANSQTEQPRRPLLTPVRLFVEFIPRESDVHTDQRYVPLKKENEGANHEKLQAHTNFLPPTGNTYVGYSVGAVRFWATIDSTSVQTSLEALIQTNRFEMEKKASGEIQSRKPPAKEFCPFVNPSPFASVLTSEQLVDFARLAGLNTYISNGAVSYIFDARHSIAAPGSHLPNWARTVTAYFGDKVVDQAAPLCPTSEVQGDSLVKFPRAKFVLELDIVSWHVSRVFKAGIPAMWDAIQTGGAMVETDPDPDRPGAVMFGHQTYRNDLRTYAEAIKSYVPPAPEEPQSSLDASTSQSIVSEGLCIDNQHPVDEQATFSENAIDDSEERWVEPDDTGEDDTTHYLPEHSDTPQNSDNPSFDAHLLHTKPLLPVAEDGESVFYRVVGYESATAQFKSTDDIHHHTSAELCVRDNLLCQLDSAPGLCSPEKAHEKAVLRTFVWLMSELVTTLLVKKAISNRNVLSPYQLACYDWLQRYKDDRGGRLFRPQSVSYRDLGLVENFLVSMNTAHTYIYNTANCHMAIQRLFLSSLDASNPNGSSKVHVLSIGAADLSKSYSLEWIATVFHNQVVQVTRETRHVASVEGSMDGAIRQQHEMPPELLGIGPGGQRLHGAEGAEFRDRLTQPIHKMRALRMDSEGQRHVDEFRLRDNSVWQGITNEHAHNIDNPTRTRFLQNHVRQSASQSTMNLAQCLGQKETPEARRVRQSTTLNLRWVVNLYHWVQVNIAAGNLPRVQTPYTDFALPRIIQELDRRGLSNTRSQRCSDRVRRAVEDYVVLNAVLYVFGDTSSPLAGPDPTEGKPRQPPPYVDSHLHYLVPYLTDAAAPSLLPLAIGVMLDQWENPNTHRVVSAIEQTFFPPTEAPQSTLNYSVSHPDLQGAIMRMLDDPDAGRKYEVWDLFHTPCNSATTAPRPPWEAVSDTHNEVESADDATDAEDAASPSDARDPVRRPRGFSSMVSRHRAAEDRATMIRREKAAVRFQDAAIVDQHTDEDFYSCVAIQCEKPPRDPQETADPAAAAELQRKRRLNYVVSRLRPHLVDMTDADVQHEVKRLMFTARTEAVVTDPRTNIVRHKNLAPLRILDGKICVIPDLLINNVANQAEHAIREVLQNLATIPSICLFGINSTDPTQFRSIALVPTHKVPLASSSHTPSAAEFDVLRHGSSGESTAVHVLYGTEHSGESTESREAQGEFGKELGPVEFDPVSMFSQHQQRCCVPVGTVGLFMLNKIAQKRRKEQREARRLWKVNVVQTIETSMDSHSITSALALARRMEGAPPPPMRLFGLNTGNHKRRGVKDRLLDDGHLAETAGYAREWRESRHSSLKRNHADGVVDPVMDMSGEIGAKRLRQSHAERWKHHCKDQGTWDPTSVSYPTIETSINSHPPIRTRDTPPGSPISLVSEPGG